MIEFLQINNLEDKNRIIESLLLFKNNELKTTQYTFDIRRNDSTVNIDVYKKIEGTDKELLVSRSSYLVDLYDTVIKGSIKELIQRDRKKTFNI